MSAPSWSVGMQRVATGIYLDGQAIHIDRDAIAAEYRLPADKADEFIRVAVMEALREVYGPEHTVVIEERTHRC